MRLRESDRLGLFVEVGDPKAAYFVPIRVDDRPDLPCD
jgi:hypothetical protein